MSFNRLALFSVLTVQSCSWLLYTVADASLMYAVGIPESNMTEAKMNKISFFKIKLSLCITVTKTCACL